MFLHGVVVDTSKIHGRGQHGVIYQAKWNGAKVAAIRVFDAIADCGSSNQELFHYFVREAEFLSKLKHPNILGFFGFFNDYGPRGGYELTPDTFIIQELVCCALDVRNCQQPQLNLRNVIDISIGVTSALCFLHERAQPIVHHNLTSKNIFLDFSGHPKIGNLAVTRTLLMGQQTSRSRQQQSLLYMAPETRHTGMKNHSSKVDIYSFGVVMLEMCIGRVGRVEDMFVTTQTSGQPQSLLPEVEWRKVDFKDLGDKHPLRPLILSCMSEIGARPSAGIIGEQLATLSQSDVYLNNPQLPVVSQLGVDSMDRGGVSKEFAMSTNSLKELTAMNEALKEENSSLIADNSLLKRKVDAYIQYEREEMENSSQAALEGLQMNEQEIEKLMSENVKLQEALLQKDKEIVAFSSPPSSLTDTQLRDQRASLMQKINDLQTSNKRELERSHLENQTLRNENMKLKMELQVLRSSKSPRKQPKHYPPHASSHHLPPSNEWGPMSLPEQLPSCSTTTSSGTETSTTKQLPSLSSLHISSSSSSSGSTSLHSTAPDSAGPSLAEFKKLKKQLERYKSVNVELDQRLKDAKLELQKYGGRQVNTDIMYRMDIDRLRAENNRLQSQLDSALSENNRLRCSRRY